MPLPFRNGRVNTGARVNQPQRLNGLIGHYIVGAARINEQPANAVDLNVNRAVHPKTSCGCKALLACAEAHASRAFRAMP